MKIFLDTAEIGEIRQAARWGVLDGVTTNPTLYAKVGVVSCVAAAGEESIVVCGATVSIRTYEGRFTSSYPVQLSGDYKRGRRVSFTLGGGAAAVEIEAFDGHIRILKPSDPLPEPGAKR